MTSNCRPQVTTPGGHRDVRRLAQATLVLCTAAFAAACASTPPPTAAVAVSAAAVSHAVSAGGADYAPVEMRAARDKLDRANLAMAAKDYDRALALAQEAQVDAQVAEAKADAGKARKATDALEADQRVLREELARKAKPTQ
ncbi:MAG TPA: DUF4398 domain-containing protein [Ideonella sp.]|nr:DUF4398 domain-containing protein [Ideonella sp.]